MTLDEMIRTAWISGNTSERGHAVSDYDAFMKEHKEQIKEWSDMIEEHENPSPAYP